MDLLLSVGRSGMKMPCNGPLKDDTGYYCPRQPENPDYDCEECKAAFERWEELTADADRDERRDTWG